MTIAGGGREVDRAHRAGAHRDAQRALGMRVEQRLRQARGLLAEHERVAARERRLGVAARRARREQPAALGRERGEERVERRRARRRRARPSSRGPARLSSRSSMRKPSGSTRCSAQPVAAHRRATLPVFGGISGSTSTTCSGASRTASVATSALARLRAHARPSRGSAAFASATSSAVRSRGAIRYATPPCARNTRVERGARIARRDRGLRGIVDRDVRRARSRARRAVPVRCARAARPGSSPALQVTEIATGSPASMNAAT